MWSGVTWDKNMQAVDLINFIMQDVCSNKVLAVGLQRNHARQGAGARTFDRLLWEYSQPWSWERSDWSTGDIESQARPGRHFSKQCGMQALFEQSCCFSVLDSSGAFQTCLRVLVCGRAHLAPSAANTDSH